MGNTCVCFKRIPRQPRQRNSRRSSNSGHHRIQPLASRNNFRDSISQEQALTVANRFLGQHHQNDGLSSISESDQSPSVPRRKKIPRSKKPGQLSQTSTYIPIPNSPTVDPLLSPNQLDKEEIEHDGFETTTHFVLVHGGGYGAWCWYKTVSLLEESGFNVTAIDLTGSGINSYDINKITTLSHYVKPLTDFLEQITDDNKVILVGHDLGGTCLSYVMELFPLKISKAVFIAAAMLTHGQCTLDMFSKQAGPDDLMQKARVFQYANGTNQAPTAIELNKSLQKDLLFNKSPTKDVILASYLMRQIPFAPALEKLSLTATRYGSVRRFYIQTLDDNAIPITLQESMINASPPEDVFIMRGADHSPFFFKPQALHKLLVEITKS